MADKTLYDILEVSTGASPEVIRAAYERLSVKFDPDRPDNSANPGARIQSDAIKEAFLTISNPAKRAQYDKTLAAASPQPRMFNVEVVEPFWTFPKVIMLSVALVFGGGYYYKHTKETARLEAEKAIAVAKAKADEEKARAEAEQAQLQLQRQREAQSAEQRQRREHEQAIRQFSYEQQMQGRSDQIVRSRENVDKQRTDAMRRQEEMRATMEAQQRAARERAELCRLERERYGRAVSC